MFGIYFGEYEYSKKNVKKRREVAHILYYFYATIINFD